MTIFERLPRWLRPLVFVANNLISIVGAILTTSSAINMIGFWAFDLTTARTINPYIGVIFVLILPGIFAIGLVLIPLGMILERHKLKAAGKLPSSYPSIDFGQPIFRHTALWVAGLTMVNVILLGVGSYRSVQYMDSANFCGQTCHTVMQPEFTAYMNSPHQRVSCVECHIGPGAGWFVKSKLSGVRQVVAVTFHTYDRPIPSPVTQLRPARETCEQCHWPMMFTGDRLIIRKKYSDDEKNTPLTTVLLMKIGGHSGQAAVGIHGRHLDAKSRVEYIATDRQRQVLPRVTYLDDSGKKVEFTSTDNKPTPEQLSAGETRSMDCVDCHNRPAHTFQLPERALDQAMAEGRISTDLPFVKKKGLEVLKAKYSDRNDAASRIATTLTEYYRTSYPDAYRDKRAAIDSAVAEIQSIYLRNIFPAMNVNWGTYPNNLGHADFPGCFRCHDGSHTSADGRTISNDCDACHTLLAVEEANPKVIADLGMK